MRLSSVGVFFLIYSVIQVCYSDVKRSPIVIVPGVGGSQIEARLDRNSSSHYYCYKKYSTWYSIWLSIEELLPYAEQCWVDNFKLQWNPAVGRMENVPGVYTRCPGFGNTSGIEWLDPSVHGPGVYFYPLVDALCKIYGYQRGITIRSAPYDFRFDPGSATAYTYFLKLHKLIEETYEINGNQKVILLSHSMGVPYTLQFLHELPQAWKDKYIKSWITLSGVYAGSMKALKSYISGDGFGIPKILDKPLTLRQFQRTFSSLAYILPDRRFWKEDEVLVKTKNKTYTISDYDELFEAMGFPLASKVLKSVPPAWDPAPPGVKMYCYHGENVQTMDVLTYKEGYFPDNLPDITYGNGDGTVNSRSLEACRTWLDNPDVDIVYKTFDGATHNGILGNTDLIKELKHTLFS